VQNISLFGQAIVQKCREVNGWRLMRRVPSSAFSRRNELHRRIKLSRFLKTVFHLILIFLMSHEQWQLIGFTASMAGISTLLVLPLGLALAWCLARPRWKGKAVLETIVTLPLVLPPVVTGLFLLQMLGRRGPVGRWFHEMFGLDIIFTWRAVVIALTVMSLPLLVRSARSAFEGVDRAYEQIARTLGAGEWRIFCTVTLPLARRGVLGGTLLAFARALGEFGATIMVAGNIPGQTTTLSVAVYQYVQLGQDASAWLLAGVSASLAFVAVLASEFLVRSNRP
jgi:molybdate transport system permease protein